MTAVKAFAYDPNPKVNIYMNQTSIDVALGKPASHSNAIDNNIPRNGPQWLTAGLKTSAGGSFQHTANNQVPWAQVDLLSDMELSTVVIGIYHYVIS